MNAKNLSRNSFLLFLMYLFIPATLVAQQSVPIYKLKKPIIDTGMLDTWPNIIDKKPIANIDGSYIAYTVANYPHLFTTLVVSAAWKTWKKEIIKNNIDDYFFSEDGKKLYWKNSDTLFSLALTQDHTDTICNIVSLQFPGTKGKWAVYKLQKCQSELIIHDLTTDKKLKFTNVVDYTFSDQLNALVAKTSIAINDTLHEFLQWVSLPEGNTIDIWKGSPSQKASSLIFDNQGGQIAFIVEEEIYSGINNSIWYYNLGLEKAILKVSAQPNKFPDSLTIRRLVQFSGNGKWLFVDLQAKSIDRKEYENTVKVDIWSYKDKVLYPQQAASILQNRQGILKVDNGAFSYVSTRDEQLQTSIPRTITGNHIVISDQKLTPEWWPHLPPPTYWLVSLEDGKRTPLRKASKYPIWAFSFSPSGKWLVYWDSEKAAYISLNTKSGKSCTITKTIPPVSRENDYVDGFYYSTYSQPIDDLAGWCPNDESVLIYDRYDIWKVDPSCSRPPYNITNGYGSKHQIKLRFVYKKREVEPPTIFTENESTLITGFNIINKHNGFFLKTLNEKGDPRVLIMGPYIYFLVESQKAQPYTFWDGMPPIKAGEGPNQYWIIQRSSDKEYPNYFLTTNFKLFRPLTNFQPQRNYNWLSAELLTWKQFDGSESQGVLYKPENFDPQKKYPVIFNYYEMLSHRLYGFPLPNLTSANINIPWFVSRGYLVFTPDIHFSIASKKEGKTVGEAAYNSIESAAMHLVRLSYVDKKRMAIQGHSFGGGITNSLITKSKLFAAACSAAGTVSNEISAYLGLVRPCGTAPTEYRLLHAETGHDRIGATLWQRPDLYIRASPVFKANQVTTPLLIMHNQGDNACDWGQSAEFYMALRRLGKKVWMLQYENESHTLEEQKNALDFTLRLTQFFDYYLKGAAPPKWMTDELPSNLRGTTLSYELDNNSKNP
jgi:dienelactone hydrolase